MEITLDAASADGGDGKPPLPRFSMVAYTGGTMRLAGWRHPVVVDLAGLAIPSQSRPIRFGHDANSGVGHTDSIAVRGGQLIAAGVISRDTLAAREVVASSKNGFPWQASIGASVEQSEYVKENQSVLVNGKEFSGPVNVVRKSVLGEISFVDLGADGNTSASVAASMAGAAAETDSSSSFETSQTQEPNPMTISAVADDTTTADTNTHSQNTPATTVSAGMAPSTATLTSATTSGPATVVASNSADDPVSQLRQRMAAETKRIDAIRTLCVGKNPKIEARAIEEGWDTTRTELELLRAGRPPIPPIGTGYRQAPTPQVFEAAALMGSGMSMNRVESFYDDQTLTAAERLRGVGIQEFCKIVCGHELPRFRSNATEWLQAAFSTASLPGILSNIANKMLLEGYSYIEDAWRRIAKIASVNDFKEHSRYRMTGSFTFEQVGADGELKHGKLDEMKFTQKADTHGIMFSLTRQMIVNDDMGAFTDIPRQIGMGAAEAIADAVWGLWLRNPVCRDGKPFFSADHRNLLSGVDSDLTVPGLTKAEVMFAEQTKPNGRPLGIPASILLVPTALKVPAEMLMKSVLLNQNTYVDATTKKSVAEPATNPHTGKFEVVSSVYLSSAAFPGFSSTAWYLLADPNRLPSIEIAFLNGVDRPTVEKTDADFNTLGIVFRGYIDFGVKEQDFRGALKMMGK